MTTLDMARLDPAHLRSPWDAIVIGGGIGGLTAAAYLALATRRVLLVEARDHLGGSADGAIVGPGAKVPLAAHSVFALDPKSIRDLKLHRNGLDYAERAMPLVSLRPGGRHLLLPHEMLAARGNIHIESSADANAYLGYRREIFALARRLRRLWTPATPTQGAITFSHADRAQLDTLTHVSAAAYLDDWFESESLKSALALDACSDGLSPHDPGSALALVWRAAQEMSGMQGAVCQIAGTPGRLAEAIARAADGYGAVLRTGIRATEILIDGGRASGVRLESGEVLRSDVVLSDLDHRVTLREFLPPETFPIAAGSRLNGPLPGVAAAKLIFVLSGPPPFAGLHPSGLRGRLVIAHRPETTAEAKAAAQLGRIAEELPVEITVPSVCDPDLVRDNQHIVSVRVSFLPASLGGGWAASRELLRRRILATLESYAPGFTDRVVASEILTPTDMAERYGHRETPSTPTRALASYTARIVSPLPGLFFCGESAEPFDAISGRAGRLAAHIVLGEGAS